MRIKTKQIVQLLFITLVISSLTSCLKDDSAKQREQETSKIQQYLSVKNITQTPTASGLYIVTETVGTGATPVAGNDVLINFKLYDIDGTASTTREGTLISTTDSILAVANQLHSRVATGGPFKTRVGATYAGMDEAFLTMKVGSKVKLIIPSILWSNDYLPKLMEIELVSILPSPRGYELQQIINFLAKDSLNLAKTPPLTVADTLTTNAVGVYLLPFPSFPGTDGYPTVGKTANVSYVGRLIDGYTFTSGTLSFVVGAGEVVTGFDQAVQTLKKGGKTRVVIPYSKGYGMSSKSNANGQIVIPYASTIVFDILLNSFQ